MTNTIGDIPIAHGPGGNWQVAVALLFRRETGGRVNSIRQLG